VLDDLVRRLDLIEGDVVLDFGCNRRLLARKIPPRARYIGFDVMAQYSDVERIEDVSPQIVVASHVLEHLSTQELDSFIDYCHRKKIRTLAVALPLENWVSGLLRWVTRTKFSNEILHKQDYRTVMKKLSESFDNTEVSTVAFMSVNSVWRPRSAPSADKAPRNGP
jgi:predicted SAM-dependent methyltransferase